ncbi:hypothetical protein PLICRDRAFT_177968 [Plicaturopsis crispa FD-325 SS-3]|nr:hypothetical protein PLICRDRAFT_177968 [Plicaturopsis crispa FD-325 SS-3]
MIPRSSTRRRPGHCFKSHSFGDSECLRQPSAHRIFATPSILADRTDSECSSATSSAWTSTTGSTGTSSAATTEGTIEREIAPPGAARRVLATDPNSGRCLLTNTDEAVELAYCVPRELEPAVLNRIEFAWNLEHGTLNTDSRYNIFPVTAELRDLFYHDEWLLIPSAEVVNTYDAERTIPVGPDFPDIPNGVFEYTLLPRHSMTNTTIRRYPCADGIRSTPLPQECSSHQYPFERLGVFKSHLHPRFVIWDLGRKLANEFTNFHLALRDMYETEYHAGDSRAEVLKRLLAAGRVYKKWIGQSTLPRPRQDAEIARSVSSSRQTRRRRAVPPSDYDSASGGLQLTSRNLKRLRAGEADCAVPVDLGIIHWRFACELASDADNSLVDDGQVDDIFCSEDHGTVDDDIFGGSECLQPSAHKIFATPSILADRTECSSATSSAWTSTSTGTSSTATIEGTIEREIAPPGTARRVLATDPNSGRCLLTNTDEAVEFAYCIPRDLDPAMLESTEYSWNMEHNTLNTDSRYNIFPVIGMLGDLFHRKDWILVPTSEQVKTYYAEGAIPVGPEFPDVPNGIFEYTLLPRVSMKNIVIPQHRSRNDLSTPLAEQAVAHKYPFEKLGVLKSHLHPRFVIWDLGRKLDKDFPDFHGALEDVYATESHAADPESVVEWLVRLLNACRVYENWIGQSTPPRPRKDAELAPSVSSSQQTRRRRAVPPSDHHSASNAGSGAPRLTSKNLKALRASEPSCLVPADLCIVQWRLACERASNDENAFQAEDQPGCDVGDISCSEHGSDDDTSDVEAQQRLPSEPDVSSMAPSRTSSPSRDVSLHTSNSLSHLPGISSPPRNTSSSSTRTTSDSLEPVTSPLSPRAVRMPATTGHCESPQIRSKRASVELDNEDEGDRLRKRTKIGV